MIFAHDFRYLRLINKFDLSSFVKTYARQAGKYRLLLRPLWASQSLFKGESAPQWRVVGTERLPTGWNQQVKRV